MRRLAVGVILALMLALAATPGTARQLVSLKPDPVVDGAEVRLGDLFYGVPAGPDQVVVSRSPAPGERLAYRVSALRAFARRHGIDWQPASHRARVYVRRASRAVPVSEVIELLREEISRAAGTDVQVEIANRDLALHVAADEEPTVAVDSVSRDSVSGRFEAVLRAPADDANAPRVRVRGRAFPLIEVPMLTRRLGADDVIAVEDVELVTLRADRVPRRVATEIDEVVGLSPKRTLASGRPIRLNDLQKPILIPKGSLVTMVYRVRAMTLTATGRTLDEASRGEVVRVLNTRSHATVEGVAAAAGKVHIHAAPTLVRASP